MSQGIHALDQYTRLESPHIDIAGPDLEDGIA